MIKTFINLSFRRMLVERSFSLLSIIGLSLATASCTIIWMYISYERSFDNFRSRDLYRVTYHGFESGIETGNSAQIVPALSPVLKNDITEVKATARLAHTAPFMSDPVMQYGDKKFRESRIYFADKDFLSMFSYQMISGNAEKAIAMGNQVVLSRSSAQRYFGNEDPVGKTLTFHRGESGPKELIVTGVFKDVPPNSHLHTDFVVSFSTLGLNVDGDWDWGNFYTYIELQPGTTADVVQSKIPELLTKHVGKYITDIRAAGNNVEFFLQPIQSIHLESRLWGELEVNGDSRTVNFLNVVAVLILIIAWINYINFSIARSSEHSKEISIRKISGSSRLQLISQLLTESALINLFAVLISLAIIQATLPILKNMIGLPDAISFGWQHGLLLFVIFFAGTLCSGLYRAVFISRLNPVTLLKTKISRSAVSMNLNRVLIVFQFTATVILIIGTITVFLQLKYARDKELGLNINQTLIVKGPATKDSTYRDFY